MQYSLFDEEEQEKVFNLLDEPWLIAVGSDGKTGEFSLVEIFARAHELKSLAGEIPTQDIAVLRLLLGVLYAVYTRAGEYEEAWEQNDPKMAMDLWSRLWKAGRFSGEEIEGYLREYHDRFWLVHPERPFWQVADMSGGTSYGVSKLMGDLSESENKLRLFQGRSGIHKKTLAYAEAARWLIYLNGFDDTSSKPTRGKDLPSVGAGWLGRIGIVYIVGNNLFETLMLNFALTDRNGNLWPDGKTTWELDVPHIGERTKIGLPDNQLELLTLQSRRISLKQKNGLFEGFILLGGDFFEKENAFTELMTLWRASDKGDEYTPKRHDTTKQFWRSFASLTVEEKNKEPGIIKWLAELKKARHIPSRNVQICSTAVKFGDKDFFVTDLWQDDISINAALLSELGDRWVNKIKSILALTEQLVTILSYLVSDLVKAVGASDGKSKGASAKEEAYFRLDMPFRDWLAAIDPENDELEISCRTWMHKARDIVLELGREIVDESGVQAFVGRELEGEGHYNTPRAHAKFRGKIYGLLKKEGYGIE